METVEEIKEHLKHGDWVKVAKLSGITRTHLMVVLGRPSSKRYSQVLRVAKKVAQSNIKLGL